MHHPLIGQGTSSSPAIPSGEQRKPKVIAHILMTGTNFFTTMQLPILLGRTFDNRDRAGSPTVAIVNEAYVKTYLDDRNPIGEHLTIRRASPLGNQDVEIIGVARNARYGALKGAYPEIVYLPFDQNSYYPVQEMTFALRTSGDPLRHLNAVREIARQADPRVPVTDVNTQAAQIDQTMTQEIIFARLCTAFAVLTLLIACVGLYGTMAYMVERRTGEIGIRMALGANRGDIVGMVLRQSFTLTGAGLAIGVPVCLISSRLVESFLFGVKPNDIVAVCFSVVILVAARFWLATCPPRERLESIR
jgi:macrolide transport system ATP-binding/permease protein